MDSSPPRPIPFEPLSPPLANDPACIRILIVDDQNFVRKMLQYSLEMHTDLEIVGTASNGEDAFGQIAQLHPDIALVDIEMPGIDG
ncbi:MAG: response regulator, partial [Thermosynechococcaceae cyanobacterium]